MPLEQQLSAGNLLPAHHRTQVQALRVSLAIFLRVKINIDQYLGCSGCSGLSAEAFTSRVGTERHSQGCFQSAFLPLFVISKFLKRELSSFPVPGFPCPALPPTPPAKIWFSCGNNSWEQHGSTSHLCFIHVWNCSGFSKGYFYFIFFFSAWLRSL